MSIVLASDANLGVAIANLRESGVLKRRRATPAPAAALTGAQAVAAVVTVATMTTILLVIAGLLYGIDLAPGAIAATACTAVIGGLVFAAIGYAVSGLIGSPEAAQPIVQATTIRSGSCPGVDRHPEPEGPLRTVGEVFQIEHLAAGLHLASVDATFAGAISVTNLLILAAWGAAAATIAAWRFSWPPSTGRHDAENTRGQQAVTKRESGACPWPASGSGSRSPGRGPWWHAARDASGTPPGSAPTRRFPRCARSAGAPRRAPCR